AGGVAQARRDPPGRRHRVGEIVGQEGRVIARDATVIAGLNVRLRTCPGRGAARSGAPQTRDRYEF
ncbi:MAG: hypothetical protein WB390_20085, partial [Pseudolabrys sp.]